MIRIFILLFICLSIRSQNIYVNDSVKNREDGVVFVNNKIEINSINHDIEWVNRMVDSFIFKNDNYSFSESEINTIRSRLSEDYVVNTFGYYGQNRTTCDFFLLFFDEKTTAIATKTNTKTGEILRWNYGAGNIYVQNDLPGQISNGTISVTSADGFNGWTVLNVSSNDIKFVPYIFWSTITKITANSNKLTKIKTSASWTALTDLELSLNTITSLTTYPTWTALQRLYIGNNSLSSVTTYPAWTDLRRLYVFQNPLTGDLPVITGSQTSSFDYIVYNGNCTSNTMTTFVKSLLTFDCRANNLTIAELDELLLNMDTWYADANLMTNSCTLDFTGTGMPIPTGGDENVNITSLASKAAGQGKMWIIIINL